MLNKLSPCWLWALLAFPAIGMTFQLATSTDPELATELIHPTGEFAARFMIIAMLASPLVLLLRGCRGLRIRAFSHGSLSGRPWVN